MRKLSCDVCVVGAGPAGSMAAFEAAKGCEVLVLEKRTQIGIPKQCGEGLSEIVFKKLKISLKEDWISHRVSFTRLISPSGIVIDLKDEVARKQKYGLVLNRKNMDKGLAEMAADEGAEFLLRTMFLGAKRENGEVRIRAKNFSEELEIKCKLVIAADGVMSRVARFFGIKTTLPLVHLEACVQYEVTNFKTEDCVEIYFGSELAPGGYVWIFPKSENSANVGLGVIPTKAKEKPLYYLKRFMKRERFRNAKIVEFNVGGVPVSGPIKKTYSDNLMIAGDAARMVNPLTGGGIHTAMISGTYAGKVASKALERSDFSEEFLEKYQRLWRDDFGRALDVATKGERVLQKLTDKEIDEIANSLKEMNLGVVDTLGLLKAIVKLNPKLFLKLRGLL
ncbi:MAG: NAD(P)/FAD-dependent oxidoreductase [Candidatus Methanofastidiosia archaeon]